MGPRQDSASSTELGEGAHAGGAGPPQQGAPSEQLAGTAAGAEPGAPRTEHDPRTEVALAGGVSMRNTTELREIVAQMQQALGQQQQAFLATIAQQQQTIERQQREIADLQIFQLAAVGTILRLHPDSEAQDRMRIEQEQEQGLAELRRFDMQQTQRVPGLAEARRDMLLRHPEREAAARAAFAQEREQSLAELRRTKRQLDDAILQLMPIYVSFGDETHCVEVPHLATVDELATAVPGQGEAGVAIYLGGEELDGSTTLADAGIGAEARVEARERALLPQKLCVEQNGDQHALSYWTVRVLSGEYSLRPERVNGAAVWGKGDCRLYRSREGHWGLTNEVDGPQRNRGELRLTSQPGSLSPVSERGWEWNSVDFNMSRAVGWQPAHYVRVRAP